MWSERNGGSAVAVPVAPEPFRYRQSDGSNGTAATLADEGVDGGAAQPPATPQEIQRQAFEQGKLQGEAQARTTVQNEVTAERGKIGAGIEKFKDERKAYFAHIESEVVQLALAISRKILHREAQMDPLLLTGMVHVALEKLDAGSRVRMRTNPADIRLWREYFAQHGVGGAQAELIGDANLRRGECCLETESGSTQMSLDGQLKEVEQGFLDLLEQRPRVS